MKGPGNDRSRNQFGSLPQSPFSSSVVVVVLIKVDTFNGTYPVLKVENSFYCP